MVIKVIKTNPLTKAASCVKPLSSGHLSDCNISRKTMYKMAPVATAFNRIRVKLPSSARLCSVKIVSAIPRGDMEEKMVI
uniref:Uncharacterized protein n=1 Tax=Tetranychus urticae TaxID=32264 RepID=T1JQJ1_TETUR